METGKQDPTIADTARACLESFNQCLEIFAILPPKQQSAIEDQLGRFSIWTANIGVFAPFRASLDYRLRGVSDVQRLVRGLLRTLNEHVEQYLSYLEPSNQNGNAHPVEDSRLGTVIDNMSEEISLLHQLSNTIRKASSERNNLKAATSFIIYDEEGNDLGPIFVGLFALEIIQRRFPDCEEKIKRRLADAMLLRRKRILYRRSRYGKATSRNVTSAPRKIKPNTEKAAASGIQSTPDQMGERHPDRSYVKAQPSTAGSRAITATTLNIEQWKKASSPSVVSKSRTIQLSNHEHLDFPPAPKRSILQKLKYLKEQHYMKHEERLKSLPNYLLYIQHVSQPALDEDAFSTLRNSISDLQVELFEEIENDRVACCKGSMEVVCPYCCCALSSATVMNNRLWIDHVKHDLDPYLCLFEDCDTSDTLYNHSEDWLKHMRQHKLRWRCTAKSHGVLVFNDQNEYEEHMTTNHKSTRSQLSIIAARSSRSSGPIFESCPLCGESNTNGPLENHVASHLRYLALKSLPFPEDGLDDRDSDSVELDSDISELRSRSTAFDDSDDLSHIFNIDKRHVTSSQLSDDVRDLERGDSEGYDRNEWEFASKSFSAEDYNRDLILQSFLAKYQEQLRNRPESIDSDGISNTDLGGDSEDEDFGKAPEKHREDYQKARFDEAIFATTTHGPNDEVKKPHFGDVKDLTIKPYQGEDYNLGVNEVLAPVSCEGGGDDSIFEVFSVAGFIENESALDHTSINQTTQISPTEIEDPSQWGDAAGEISEDIVAVEERPALDISTDDNLIHVPPVEITIEPPSPAQSVTSGDSYVSTTSDDIMNEVESHEFSNVIHENLATESESDNRETENSINHAYELWEENFVAPEVSTSLHSRIYPGMHYQQARARADQQQRQQQQQHIATMDGTLEKLSTESESDSPGVGDSEGVRAFRKCRSEACGYYNEANDITCLRCDAPLRGAAVVVDSTLTSDPNSQIWPPPTPIDIQPTLMSNIAIPPKNSITEGPPPIIYNYTPTTHRISHAKKGRRMYACELPGCNKRFTRSEHLSRHKLHHNPEAFYRCTYEGCKKVFYHSDLLARHIARHEAAIQLDTTSATASSPVASLPGDIQGSALPPLGRGVDLAEITRGVSNTSLTDLSRPAEEQAQSAKDLEYPEARVYSDQYSSFKADNSDIRYPLPELPPPDLGNADISSMWSANEDAMLINAMRIYVGTRRYDWDYVKSALFPNKTADNCRSRYEHLMREGKV